MDINNAAAWLRLRTACAARLLPLLPFLALPAVVQAQDYTYAVGADGINITRYTGPCGAVIIPKTIDGELVTSIGAGAFSGCYTLTSVTIPNSVTSIGYAAFRYCTNLASVTIPNSVTSIGGDAFHICTSLSSVTIPNSVTSIGPGAFGDCTSLTSVTIPNSVTNIGDYTFYSGTSLTRVTIPNSVTSIGSSAFFGSSSLTNVTIGNSVTNIGSWTFESCTSLNGVYFQGNAPSADSSVFDGATNVTVFYLPGTTNWGLTFAGRPTALWKPQVQSSDASFGVRTNQFGFTITWASGRVIVVEACTNLANPTWSPLQTNTLSGDSFYFSDPQWTDYPARFYRLRWP